MQTVEMYSLVNGGRLTKLSDSECQGQDLGPVQLGPHTASVVPLKAVPWPPLYHPELSPTYPVWFLCQVHLTQDQTRGTVGWCQLPPQGQVAGMSL